MTTLRRAWVVTPLGRMLALASDRGLCALEFDGPTRHARLDARLARWFGAHEIVESDAPPIAQARAWLAEYFDGGVPARDATPPLDMRGTAFERRVWAALVEIPHGETTSYGAIAAKLGDSGASRAVGAANGANPVAIVVPCHRVIGSTGSLVGYGGGLEKKRWLLAHEGVRTPMLQSSLFNSQ